MAKLRGFSYLGLRRRFRACCLGIGVFERRIWEFRPRGRASGEF